MSVGSFTEELSVDGCWEMLEPEAFTRVTDSALARVPLTTDAELRRARLLRTVEGEIIPRLLMAGRAARADSGVDRMKEQPTPDDVRELARVLLLHDESIALAFVQSVRQRGAGIEAICPDLLAPAARLLGTSWEEDGVTFLQVTMGLCRLHGVLRELNPSFRTPALADPRERGRRALLVPAPGEQHTFGLLMVGEFMRRAGWEVWTEFPASGSALEEMVASNWFAVAGLSLGSEVRIDELTGAIRSIRQGSRNRSIGVMVGGPIFLSHPELVAVVGADQMAANAQDAIERAEHVFAQISALN